MSARPKPGDEFPLIEGETPDGLLRIAEYRGSKHVVLWTYPKDATPGWTVEAIEFSQRSADFANAGAELVGLSKDTVESHRRFAAQHDLRCRLIADPKAKIIRQIGVDGPLGIAHRVTFVIDKQGIVRRVFEDVKVRGHAAEVLEFVRTLWRGMAARFDAGECAGTDKRRAASTHREPEAQDET